MTSADNLQLDVSRVIDLVGTSTVSMSSLSSTVVVSDKILDVVGLDIMLLSDSIAARGAERVDIGAINNITMTGSRISCSATSMLVGVESFVSTSQSFSLFADTLTATGNNIGLYSTEQAVVVGNEGVSVETLSSVINSPASLTIDVGQTVHIDAVADVDTQSSTGNILIGSDQLLSIYRRRNISCITHRKC